jgi:hypothetical protein
VRIGSLTALSLGLQLVAQALATWNTARAHLKRLARSSIERHFKRIACYVPWEISLAPPRLTELLPVARMADDLVREFRSVTLASVGVPGSSPAPRDLQEFPQVRRAAEQSLGVQAADPTNLGPLFNEPSYNDDLRREMTTKWQQVALIQSESWSQLWRVSDAVVCAMEGKYWQRLNASRATEVVAPAEGPATPMAVQQALEDARIEAAGKSLSPAADTPQSPEQDAWIAHGERFVALQMAFFVRDIVARTITCLFAAMLCLTFLATSHLLYVFNGRVALLTIDVFAIAAAALASVWILVDMERDHVLSRVRSTVPGRVSLNWDFMRRIVIYGVLPLLVIVSALFPEVGGSLFGWLEPLRKLSTL